MQMSEATRCQDQNSPSWLNRLDVVALYLATLILAPHAS